MLQPRYGGAFARPFVTHHNELEADLYLRIATELYLKRLIVGGLERVYELGKDFRNEGVSYKYNPEFTMLEWYEAYADYGDAMERLETMIEQVALETIGTTSVRFRGHDLDLKKPWRRVRLPDALAEHGPLDARRRRAAGGARRPRRGRPSTTTRGRSSRTTRSPTSSSRPSSSRRSCTTTRSSCRRSPARWTTTPRSSSASSTSWAAWSSATRTPRSTTPRSRRPASSFSSPRSRRAPRRSSRTTPTTSRRSATGCRRRPASGSASTAWRWCSRAATASAT